MGYKVVIAGATGNVGREMLNILSERAFPVTEVVALASSRSVGTEVSFGDKTLTVHAALLCLGDQLLRVWSQSLCLWQGGGNRSSLKE